MATLALSIAGAAVGTQIGGSILWGTVSAAAVGQAVGGMAGSVIDQMLLAKFSDNSQRVTAPPARLQPAALAAEGQPVARVWGRGRPSPQIWWSSKYKVIREATTQEVGGKGLLGGGRDVTTESVRVFISLMLVLCEGPIDGIGDVYINGEPLDKAGVTLTVYRGTADQPQDPTIAALDPDPPAFRGLAYVVLDNLEVPAGGTLPQINCEVRRGPTTVEAGLPAVAYDAGALATADTTIAEPAGLAVEPLIQNVGLIPATGKWTLHPRPLAGRQVNRFSAQAVSDAVAALDGIQQTYPNLTGVTLFVSWFGSSLAAGSCVVEPKAEDRTDLAGQSADGNSGADDAAPGVVEDGTYGGGSASVYFGSGLGAYTPDVAETVSQNSWRVSGLDLNAVSVISQVGGGPAYGATPSDRSVFMLLREIAARGLSITLVPFLLMDDGADYPWRGRITGSDGDAAAVGEVAAFMGSAAPGEFGAWDGRTIPFSGSGMGWRRCVLHYAALAAAAGNVGSFVIGTEFRGLERLRDDTGAYPFVAALKALAADVRTLLPGAEIGYAADWSSFANHRPDDGSGDVIFNLDPLWSDANVDFVGIDNYFPLSDWRYGDGHLDAAGAPSIYDLAYLQGNVAGGELYDWFYASQADRDAQNRTPIVDASPAAEHWVFAPKRLHDWWANAHHDRPGGTRSATPTGWTAKMKPIRFVEIGCPAVDKGSNQPNVFVDTKSVESFLPYYSSGFPDIEIQRRHLLATWRHWAANNEAGFIDLERSAVYAEDLRPWPAFPLRDDIWSDGPNWWTGHWTSGRLGAMPVGLVMAELAAAVGVPLDRRDCYGSVLGYVLEERSPPRGPIEQLASLFSIDLFEADGRLIARSRAAAPVVSVDRSTDLAMRPRRDRYAISRAQESELPREVALTHYLPGSGYRPITSTARRRLGGADGEEQLSVPVVMDREQAAAHLQRALAERWIGRERLSARLAPVHLARRPGDVLRFEDGSEWRLSELASGWGRAIEAVSADARLLNRSGASNPAARAAVITGRVTGGAPVLKRLDLPLLSTVAVAHAPYFAAWASPWPRAGVQVWRSRDGTGWLADTRLRQPAVMGTLTAALPAAPEGILDRASVIEVSLFGGALGSITQGQLWSGRNAAAVLGDNGEWEVLQFQTATLQGDGSWHLSVLRRGLGGSGHAMGASLGQPFVMLDAAALSQPLYPAAERGVVFDWRYGDASLLLSDPALSRFTSGFTGVGLRPWPVAQPQARRQDDGGIALTFRRRGRLGGGLPGADPALGFAAERYRLRVHVSGSVVREWDHAGPGPVLYADDDALSDHGARPSSLDWSVAQLDDAALPGPFRRQTQEI